MHALSSIWPLMILNKIPFTSQHNSRWLKTFRETLAIFQRLINPNPTKPKGQRNLIRSISCLIKSIVMDRDFYKNIPYEVLFILSWWRHQWKHFPRYWPFVVNIPLTKPSDTELWCFLWSAPVEYGWGDGWVNNREAGDLRRHRAHYDVIVM